MATGKLQTRTGIVAADVGAGDDATDDTAALQAAIDTLNAAGGGKLILPDGKVFRATQLVLKSGVSIESDSGGIAAIRMASEPGAVSGLIVHDPVNGSHRCAIRNLRLLGPSEGSPLAASGNADGISMRDGVGIAIENVWVEGFSNDGIKLNGASTSTNDPEKSRIVNCVIRNCNRAIFAIHGLKDLIISGNNIEQIGAAAVVVDDLSGESSYGPPPERAIVANNTIHDWGRLTPSSPAILVASGAGAVIANNTLQGNSNSLELGIAVATGGSDAIGGAQVMYGPVIQGNTFYNIEGVNLSLQGVKGAVVGPNTYINPGRGSGGSGSTAVQLAQAVTPGGGTTTHCAECKIIGQVIIYENGVSDELEYGIRVTASQTDCELLFNTVLAGTNRITDGGTRTMKVGNRTTTGSTPRFLVDGVAEISNHLHMTRDNALIQFDRPSGGSAQYTGLRFRQDNGGGSFTNHMSIWYDHVNDLITFFDGSNGFVFGVEDDGRIRTNQTAAATTLGNVTDRMPVYDEDGALVGYIPIYDAIT